MCWHLNCSEVFFDRNFFDLGLFDHRISFGGEPFVDLFACPVFSHGNWTLLVQLKAFFAGLLQITISVDYFAGNIELNTPSDFRRNVD